MFYLPKLIDVYSRISQKKFNTSFCWVNSPIYYLFLNDSYVLKVSYRKNYKLLFLISRRIRTVFSTADFISWRKSFMSQNICTSTWRSSVLKSADYLTVSPINWNNSFVSFSFGATTLYCGVQMFKWWLMLYLCWSAFLFVDLCWLLWYYQLHLFYIVCTLYGNNEESKFFPKPKALSLLL